MVREIKLPEMFTVISQQDLSGIGLDWATMAPILAIALFLIVLTLTCLVSKKIIDHRLATKVSCIQITYWYVGSSIIIISLNNYVYLSCYNFSNGKLIYFTYSRTNYYLLLTYETSKIPGWSLDYPVQLLSTSLQTPKYCRLSIQQNW